MLTIWAFKSCIFAKICEDHETVDTCLNYALTVRMDAHFCILSVEPASELKKFSSRGLFTVKIHLVVCMLFEINFTSVMFFSRVNRCVFLKNLEILDNKFKA